MKILSINHFSSDGTHRVVQMACDKENGSHRFTATFIRISGQVPTDLLNNPPMVFARVNTLKSDALENYVGVSGLAKILMKHTEAIVVAKVDNVAKVGPGIRSFSLHSPAGTYDMRQSLKEQAGNAIDFNPSKNARDQHVSESAARGVVEKKFQTLSNQDN
jgi:hypothetical protein